MSRSRDQLNEDYTRLQSLMEGNGPLGPGSATIHDRNAVVEPVKPGQRIYTPEREALHREIILEIVNEARSRGVPKDRKVILMAGVPASGKTTIRDSRILGESPMLIIDTDDVKRRLVSKLEARRELPDIPEFGPDERHLQLSGKLQRVHSEASDVVTKVIAEARMQGLNMVVDDTMRDKDKTVRRIAGLRRDKYQVEACYVCAPIEQAQEQARTRCIDAWLNHDPRGATVIPTEVWAEALRHADGVIDNARIFVELVHAGAANGGFDRGAFVDCTGGRRLGRDGLPGVVGVTWEAGIRRDHDLVAARHLDQMIPPHLRSLDLQR